MIIELESIFNTDGMKVPFDYELSLASVEVSGYAPIADPVRVSGCIENKAGMLILQQKPTWFTRLPVTVAHRM